MSTFCKYCGSRDIEYRGVEDGHGAYGTGLADIFTCNACGLDFIGYEMDFDDMDGVDIGNDAAEDTQVLPAVVVDDDPKPPPKDMDDIPF